MDVRIRWIIDRADRMLRQSQILRKMADELRQESNGLRASAKRLSKYGRGKKR